MMLAFPPFEPDKAIYDPNASQSIVNGVPVADGWGPFPNLVATSDALASAPKGFITARTSGGVQVTVVGTTTALYTLSAGGSFTDVTPIATTLALPDGDEWSFAIFGSRILATNLSDGVFYYDIGTSTEFAALPGSPPKARYVKSVGDFVFLIYLSTDPSGMAWSGVNNSEYWTAGTQLSDTQTFPDGEELMGLVPNGTNAIVCFRKGFRVMTYAPDSGFIFTFSPLVEGKGVDAALSLVSIGNGDFVYYNDTGFFRGINGTPIGAERVDRWIKTVCTQTDRRKIKGVADPFRKMVFWRYVDSGGTGYILAYSWDLDRWFTSDVAVTALGTYASSSYTLEDLDAIYGDLDSIPISLDSEQLQGGFPALAGFDASYQLGFFNGTPMEFTVITNMYEFNEGYRSSVDQTRGVTDASTFSIAVGKSDDRGDTPTWGAAKSPSARSKFVYLRADARLHSFRFKIPAGTTWNAATGITVEPKRTGKL